MSSLTRLLLPVIAIAVVGIWVAIVIAVSGYTFAYDYLAYDAAARRLLAGEPLYDLSFTETGAFGLFYYPPPFVLSVLPFTLASPLLASWLWIGLTVAAYAAAIAILPVRREVRWITFLLLGVSWPFLFTVKVGQVGSFLLLAFAVGWRALDRPLPLGLSVAAGAAIKLQPLALVGWLVVTRRWSALGWCLAALAVLAAIATVVAGPGAWMDFATLIVRTSDALEQPQNVAPSSVVYFAGASPEVARVVWLGWSAAVVLVALLAALRAPADVGYLVAVVATQVVSPILWDHYAIVLALPVAWLLERRQWWVALVPLSQSVVMLGTLPAVGWSLGYAVVLVALLVIGLRSGRGGEPAPTRATAPAAG